MGCGEGGGREGRGRKMAVVGGGAVGEGKEVDCVARGGEEGEVWQKRTEEMDPMGVGGRGICRLEKKSFSRTRIKNRQLLLLKM